MIACYREDLILCQAALAVGHLHWTGTATDDLSLIKTPKEVCGVMNVGALTQEMVAELQSILAAYYDPMVGLAQIEGQLGSLGLWEPFSVRYDPLLFHSGKRHCGVPPRRPSPRICRHPPPTGQPV